jgi:hypothetical protein
MSLKQVCCVIAVASLVSLSVGCSSEKKLPGQKPTFKVKGMVTLDGAVPDPGVAVICFPKDSVESPDNFVPSAKTDDKGNFEFHTYKASDGVPAGEYVLTFSQRKFDMRKRSYAGPDLLKGRYSDKKYSQFEFKVVNKSVDLGSYELTSK